MATQAGSLDLRAVKQAYIKTVAQAQPIYKRTNTNSAPPNAPTSKITATTDQGTSGNWTLNHMPAICSTNTAYKYLWTCNQFIAPDGTFLGCSDVVPDEGTTVIDGANIVTGTVTAEKIQAHSIGASQIAISDSTNLAVVNEAYEGSIPTDAPSNYVAAIDNGYLTKKVSTQQYLMLTDYTKNNFNVNDELYYEFYGKAETAGNIRLTVWAYNGTPASHTVAGSDYVSIALTTTETFYSGTLTLSNAGWATGNIYILGFNDNRSTKSQIYIRKCVIRRKSGGNLIVDGAITADKLAANAVTIGKMDSETAAMMPWTSDTETAPYLIRKSGETIAHDFSAEYNKIIGGSVAWNQLVANSGSSLSVTVASGHKYLLKKGTAWSIGTSDGTAITGLTGGTDMVIDLTRMFGVTIADYISTLESGTAGAGVAWFRKYFTSDYYEYSAQTMKSVEGLSAHKTTGKNLFDKYAVTDGYYINSSGTEASSSAWCISDYISVPPLSTLYYSGCPGGFGTNPCTVFYDKNQDFKSSIHISSLTGGTISVPDGARYIRLSVAKADKETFQLEIGDEATAYEPYTGRTYSLDSTLSLGGIPKLDANNALYYDGDIYDSTGVVTRKYGIVNLGTVTWSRTSISGSGYRFFCNDIQSLVKIPASTSEKPDILCSGYDVKLPSQYNAAVDGITIYTNGSIQIYDVNLKASTTAAFKTAMNGIKLVYPLATPTTEQASPYANPQSADPLGTEEYVSTSIVPVGNETQYANEAQAGAGVVTGELASSASKVATNYITHIDNNGIRVHPASTENNSVLINANGMEIFKGGTATANSVALYGDTARIGKTADSHVEIAPSSITMQVKTTTDNAPVDAFKIEQLQSNTIKSLYTYNRSFPDGDESYVRDVLTIGKVITYWDTIKVNYKINNGSVITDTYEDFYNQSVNQKYYFSVMQYYDWPNAIEVTFSRGDTATSSETITIVSIEFGFITGQTAVEHTLGAYSNTAQSGVLRIGNGNSSNDLSNAMLLDWGGNAKFNGDVRANCNSDSSGGLSLIRPTVVTSRVVSSLSNLWYSYDVYRLGRVIVLTVKITKDTSTSAGANIMEVSVAAPKPYSSFVTGGSFFGNKAIGLMLYTSGNTVYLRVRNASTATLDPFYDELWGSITYITSDS